MDEITYVGLGELTYKSSDDGSLIVYGKATGPDLDLDQQICDPEWLKTAMPQWMATGANLREMHQSIAAGVGLELSADGSDWMLKGEVVDENTARKVKKGVLKGYSIGIKQARVVKSDDAPNGRIVGGQIVEVSLVDRPANPTATVTIAKAYNGGELEIAKGIDLQPLIPDTQQSHDEVANLVPQLVVHDAIVEAEDGDEAYPSAEPCPKCNGLGSMPDDNSTCSYCGGSGKFPAEGEAHTDADMPYTRTRVGDKAADADAQTPRVQAVRALISHLSGDVSKMEHDPVALASVRDGLIALVKAELDEMVAGEENEIADVAQLLSALDLYLDWWTSEASENETTPPFSGWEEQGDTMSYVGLGVSADLIKAAAADDATPEVKDDLRTEIVKALGLEEAITAKAELSKAVEQIDLLKAALDEVREMATPGGPHLRATQSQTAKAADAERLQAEAGYYKRLASEVFDPAMKSGYLTKAADLEADAKALLRN